MTLLKSLLTAPALPTQLADLTADPRTQIDQRQTELAYSPPQYPSPWADREAVGWEDSYAKAKAFVSQLTLLEKVNLTTGVGYVACLRSKITHNA